MRTLEAPRALQSSPVVEMARGGVELIAPVADEWRALCEETTGEPFYRPEWVAAFVRAFVPRGQFVLFTVRSAGRLAAVLPMIEERVLFSGLPVRKLSGCDDVPLRFDLVRRPGAAGDAACRALWEHLKRSRGWDVLEFPDVPPDSALELLLGAAAEDGFPTARRECMQTPYLPLDGWDGSDDYWIRQVGANLRHSLRRRRRRLEEGGPIVLRRYDAYDLAALQRFYEIEASGWKGREGSAIGSDETRQKYHDELALEAVRYGYFALYLLEWAGKTIAGQFGFAYHGRYLALKIAVDDRHREYGLGHLLTNAILLDCSKRGLVEYDFIAHNAEWKQKWTSHFRSHAYFFIFRKGFYGRLIQFAKLRMNPFVKRMMGREEKLGE